MTTLTEVEMLAESISEQQAVLANQITAAQQGLTANAAAISAELSKVLAEEQAGIATSKAVLTAADRVQTGLDVISAEAAALAANSSAKVFASTALGVAGTVDGENFSVLSADSQDLIIYLHDGVDATELYRIKTKAFIDACGLDPSSYSSRTGYVFAWLDSTDKMALGINNAGKVIFGKGGDIAADIATLVADVGTNTDDIATNTSDIVTINNELNTLPTLSSSGFERSGYHWAWQDSQGNLAGGLGVTGNIISKGLDLTTMAINSPEHTLDTSYYRSGYSWAWQDSQGNLAGGLDATGNIISKGLDLTTMAINSPEHTLDTSFDRSGYSWAWVDTTGNLAGGLDTTGNIVSKGTNITTVAINSPDNLLDSHYDRSGYYWAWEDSQGNLAGGIDSAGNLISKGINLTTQNSDVVADVSTNAADILAIERIITPSGFWWYGDSLSQNGVGPKLAALLGKPVTVGGVGGLSGNSVSVRYGGEVSFFTLANNTIPATTTAVDVTVRTVDPINNQNLTSLTGTLAGVHGSFSSDASTYWRFTRTTAGTAKVIDPATPFIIDVLDQRHYGTNVFWYGRNNVHQDNFNANVKRAIADSIAQIKTIDKRFVVLGVLNWPDEPIGTGFHTAIELLNSELKTMYPRNFVDVLNLLRRSGDGSPEDIADADSGIIPRSLRGVNDGHLNNTTGNTVVANRVYEFLIEKGWT